MRSCGSERGFAPFSIQRQVAFQHCGRIGKGRHQVRDEAEGFLDAFQGGSGGGRRIFMVNGSSKFAVVFIRLFGCSFSCDLFCRTVLGRHGQS